MWKAIIIIFFGTMFSSIGDGFLSKGLRELQQVEWSGGFFSVSTQYIRAAIQKPGILIGVSCHAVFFASILLAYSWGDLSLVLPITALTYVFAPLIAQFYLNENVNMMRWMGAAIIVIGVCTVLLGERGNVNLQGQQKPVGELTMQLETQDPEMKRQGWK
jgi:drug/metabolite transporter (DMT)-like permease